MDTEKALSDNVTPNPKGTVSTDRSGTNTHRSAGQPEGLPASAGTGASSEYYLLTKKLFDKLAPFYDIMTLPFAGIRETVVRFTGVKDGARVLDIATGTGKQAFAFAERGCDVIGIDLSEGMLEVAIKKNKYANLKFGLGDAANLSFKDNRFDVCCVSFALHDMPLPIREMVLEEMVRVTKPGGKIVIVDYALPKNRVGRFLAYHLIKLYERGYYSEFIKSDLKELIGKTGIEIEQELSVLKGAGKIWSGIKP